MTYQFDPILGQGRDGAVSLAEQQKGFDAGSAAAKAAFQSSVSGDKIPLTQKGAASGVATLGADSKIPASQISAAGVYAGQSGINGLILNGSCQSGTNLGFSSMIFDSSNFPFGASGCFKSTGNGVNGVNGTYYSDYFLQVDVNSLYELSLEVKQLIRLSGIGVCYVGIAGYDVSGNLVDSMHVGRIAASDTTLASPLSIGDATVVLASGQNWRNTTDTQNFFSFYNYKDAFGFVYDRSVNPYTRHQTFNESPQWLAGAVSGGTITLAANWSYANPAAGSGGVWPAGTPVSCGRAGPSFAYPLGYIAASTQAWGRKVCYFGGGIDMSGNWEPSRFRPGVAKVKIVLMANYGPAAASDVTGFGNIGMYRAPITRAMAGLA